MVYSLLFLVLVILIYGPQWWVRFTLSRYNREIDSLSGTGGELAQHLINRFQLSTQLEQCQEGADHYEPASDTVRLSPSYFNAKSITAVAVAAHEVGHALQFSRKETISQLRQRYLPLAMRLKKVGIVMLMGLPIVGFLLKSPVLIAAYVGLSLLFQLLGALCYLVILPEEWDASFNKALPILAEGYLDQKQLHAARRVLKAAALTYFAAALAEMLNIGRWWLILRR